MAKGLLCLWPLVFLMSCKTVRTVKGVRQGTTTFDSQLWGGQGESADTDKIKEKFTQRGYTIGDDGNIIADKNNLYSDSSARVGNKEYAKKEARLKNRETEKKLFDTPDYLERQTYSGGKKSAKEGGLFARESNFGRNRAAESSQGNYQTSEVGFRNSQARTNSFDKGDTYKTFSNRTGMNARANAPTADGVLRTRGYFKDSALSVSDVKKMVDPGAYAAAKGL